MKHLSKELEDFRRKRNKNDGEYITNDTSGFKLYFVDSPLAL